MSTEAAREQFLAQDGRNGAAKRLASLARVITTLTSAASPERVGLVLTSQVGLTLRASAVAFALLDADGALLRIAVAVGSRRSGTTRPLSPRVDPGRGVGALPPVRRALETLLEGPCLVAPLVHQGRFLGALAARLPEGSAPDARDRAFLRTLAGVGALAVADVPGRWRGTTGGVEWTALVERGSDAILVCDLPSGAIRVWSRGAEVLYGWSSTEALGASAHTLLRTQWPFPFETIEALLARDGSWQGDLVQWTRDGRRIVVASRWTAVRDADGHASAYLEVNSDVTSQREVEQRARVLAEAGRALIGSHDPAETLANVARLCVPALADWCLVDLVADGGTVRRVAIEHADPGRAPLAEALRRAFAAGTAKPPRSLAARVLRSGRPELRPDVHVATLVSAARDPEHLSLLRAVGICSMLAVPLVARGRSLGALTLLMAESGRRYRPEDLAMAEDLAGRCALALDNARLYVDAQAALRRRDDALDALLHDLRNPLTALAGQVHVLGAQATNDELETARLQEGLDRVSATAKQMADMLHELQDATRLQADHPLDLTREPTDLVSLVRLAVEDARWASPARAIRVAGGEEPLVGDWDPLRLTRMLGKLLSNAVKFSPPESEILVTLRGEQTVEGAWAEVRVRDHGGGIAAADLPRLFTPYARAADAVGTVRGGGLGLADVRQVAEQFGGSVQVESEEGSGSTFIVRLPLAMGAAAAPRVAVPASAPRAEPALVLVVDHEPTIRAAVKVALELRGYAVDEAASGEAALQILDNRRPALVLADWHLPGQGGLALARSLAARPSSPPLLLMSGSDDVGRWATDVGAAGVIHKPFALSSLLAAVERAIGPAAS